MIPQPTSDQVLIKILDNYEEKVGSIYIADTAWKEVQRGEVISVGPGLVVPPIPTPYDRDGQDNLITRGPMQCRVGDIVLCQKSLGVPLPGHIIEEEIGIDKPSPTTEYRCIREPEIRLILSRDQRGEAKT